jgi:hypothetical protein
MFDFRNSVIQMTAGLLTSFLSTLLIEQRWKAALAIILIGTAGVLLLGIAFAIARIIERKFQVVAPTKKKWRQQTPKKRRPKR